MLREANGNWLGLTDGDFVGNLLGLFDSNALDESNGDLLGLADGTLKATCWGSLMAMHWVMDAKIPLMATNPCLLSFFSHQSTLN